MEREEFFIYWHGDEFKNQDNPESHNNCILVSDWLWIDHGISWTLQKITCVALSITDRYLYVCVNIIIIITEDDPIWVESALRLLLSIYI